MLAGDNASKQSNIITYYYNSHYHWNYTQLERIRRPHVPDNCFASRNLEHCCSKDSVLSLDHGIAKMSLRTDKRFETHSSFVTQSQWNAYKIRSRLSVLRLSRQFIVIMGMFPAISILAALSPALSSADAETYLYLQAHCASVAHWIAFSFSLIREFDISAWVWHRPLSTQSAGRRHYISRMWLLQKANYRHAWQALISNVYQPCL